MNKYDFIECKYGGGVKMAIMAKDKPTTFVVRTSNAKQFIENTSKSKMTNSFLAECMESAKLFKIKK